MLTYYNIITTTILFHQKCCLENNNYSISILSYKRIASRVGTKPIDNIDNILDRTKMLGKNNYYLLGKTQQFARYPQSIMARALDNDFVVD